ncbi:hypothetical protein A130_04020 [Vibrio genomosp. F6 str. FF-238]|uniref:Uncharacterized protein n=1 Tax=Vibrio genomosp. F6 str. FF-238 TaxID=1191298 RepID=A0A1E5D1T4_9VIBR|nr:hypothetical protein A130_04020 [Vibrio genomosp. F6 str. FF-238]
MFSSIRIFIGSHINGMKRENRFCSKQGLSVEQIKMPSGVNHWAKSRTKGSGPALQGTESASVRSVSLIKLWKP